MARKIAGAKFNLKTRPQVFPGRLIGLGLRDDRSGQDIQFFRMDYHPPHKTYMSTWEKDYYYNVENEGRYTFNFHVPR